jgi:hypothetical protein
VLPAPLVSAMPTQSIALTPTPSRCHQAPRVVMPHLSAAAPASRAPVASPAHARPARPSDVRCPPLSEWSGAAAPVLAHMAPLPSPSLSAPLLPPRGTQSDPLPFSSPPRHRTATKRHRPTPSLVSPFSSHKRRCTAPPPPLASPQCPVHRRRPRGAGPHRTAPDSIGTAPPPSFVGEHRPELQSVTTNRPPTHCPPPQAAGARLDRR